jgi:cyclohexadieny/prephenate dehydrogenase
MVIIGVGLIGSSLLRAARQRNLAKTLVAADLSADVCARVREIGIADEVFQDAREAVCDADLVILCTPVGSIGDVAAQIASHLKNGSILSDVGSVKASVVAAVQPHLPPSVHFIPAHPVAGTEYSGPDAGFSTLFVDRWCILTPPENASENEVSKLQMFWTEIGSNVEVMTPAHHDLVLAITSHVPHLIAYNIVGTAADLEEVTQSEVWRDIFLNNKDAVLEMLGRFNEDLAALQRMIRWGDGQGLFDLFTRTRAIRRSIVAQGQDAAAPDFGRRSSSDNKS